MRTDSIEIKEINYDLIKELAKDKSLVFAKKGNIKGYGLYVNSELVSMVALDFLVKLLKSGIYILCPIFAIKGMQVYYCRKFWIYILIVILKQE